MVNLFLLFFVIVVTESKVCRRSSDFEYGQWIPGAQNCGLLDKYSPNDNVTDFANWCWKPFGCESTKFSAKHFCKLMKGRTMLMVGDSLLYNMYVAFYNLLASEINVSPPTVSGNFGFYPGKDYGKVCNGNASIIYLRNDHWGIKNERTDKDINLNQLWKSGLPEVDILMMNKGHHVVPKEVSEKQFVDQTTEAVAYLKNYKLTERSGHHKNNNGSSEVFMHHRNGTYHHRPISFYFLQTSPGHAFCLSLDSKPYTDLVSNVEQYNTIHQKYEVEKLSKFKHAKEWNWWNYTQHDDFIEKLFVEELDGVVIPITHMTFLRPDGHQAFGRSRDPGKDVEDDDCLHYHNPSVVDDWVHVFYQLLLEDKNVISKIHF